MKPKMEQKKNHLLLDDPKTKTYSTTKTIIHDVALVNKGTNYGNEQNDLLKRMMVQLVLSYRLKATLDIHTISDQLYTKGIIRKNELQIIRAIGKMTNHR